MKKQLNNILGIILILTLVFSMFPIFAVATTDETDDDVTEQIEEIPNDETSDETPKEPPEEDNTKTDDEEIGFEQTSFEIMPLNASFSTVNHTRSDYRITYGAGGHRTSFYTANGNTAFCINPNLRGINTGTYPVSRHIERGTGYDLLIKGAYYLYGGPGYDSVKHSLFTNPDDLLAYGYSHAALSYIFTGDEPNAFIGLSENERQHLRNVISVINAQPMPPRGFSIFIYNEGVSRQQAFLGWNYIPAGHLEIRKTSTNPAMSDGSSLYSLQGAVFDVFNGANQKLGSITTDVNGRGRLNDIEADETGLYIVEVTPPKGFALNTNRISFEIVSGQTVTVTVSNRPQNDPVGIILRKRDADTSNPTPQGGALLAGAEFTIKYYPELYSTASQLSGLTPTRTWVVRTDNNGVAFLLPNYLVSGDPFYYAGNNDPTLPLGTITIQETKAPEGYHLNDELFIRQITSTGFAESVRTYNVPIIPEIVMRGGMQIEKWDIERDQSQLKQGDTTLAGAVLEIWNRSVNSVVVNGVEYAPNAIVHTMTTNANGWAGTANNLLPYGNYEVIERTPPTGYLNTGIIRQSFQIRESGVIVDLRTNDTVIKNNIIRGGLHIEKWDNETEKREPQGNATLEGAVFEIVNRSTDSVLVQGTLYAVGDVVYTLTTDNEGIATTANDLLPYGSYEVREISPPLQGYLATGVLSRNFEIREHEKIVELNTADTAIRNDPIRGDLQGVKISGGNAHRMANVPFRITSVTTGESHVIITDINGELNTSSQWNPHSQNTNRGETDKDGIWFGEIETLDDNVGALLFDTYLIEELRCEANEGRELFEFEVSVYRHNHVINLGTLTNEYVPTPDIFTTAMDRETTLNSAFVSESTTIIDTIYFSGLQSGRLYTLKGVLMDKETEEPLLIDGEQVTAETTFRAFAESGAVTMDFTFNSLTLSGNSVVVFQYLYQGETEIVAHADIDDEMQTVTFIAPKIGTSASGIDGEKVLDIRSEVLIIDKVYYENLISGETYTIVGRLMDKDLEEPLLIDGMEVTAQTTFTATEESGTVEVVFTLNSIGLIGKTVVVFEYLYHGEKLIAEHTDIEDEEQTVTFKTPNIGTLATGKDGNKIIPLDETAEIIDTVSYENLSVGETYILVGLLMDKETGEPVLVDGEEVTIEITFIAEQSQGSVEVVFIFDSTGLDGKTLVVFEYLYYEDALIAEHTDIDDEAQTVTVESETPEPPPTPNTPQTGQDGLPYWLLATVTVLLITAIVLTIYTRKRWKNEPDE